MPGKKDYLLWLARLLIAGVTAWNIQAALIFILCPGCYAPAFELTGLSGMVAIRATGILFLMWNVPYLVALWHPRKYSLALGMALAMQLIGLVGESLILFSLPGGNAMLKSSITRFVLFDGVGLIMLLGAYGLVKYRQNH